MGSPFWGLRPVLGNLPNTGQPVFATIPLDLFAILLQTPQILMGTHVTNSKLTGQRALSSKNLLPMDSQAAQISCWPGRGHWQKGTTSLSYSLETSRCIQKRHETKKSSMTLPGSLMAKLVTRLL